MVKGWLIGSEVTGSLIVQFIGYTQVSLGLLSGYHTPIGDDERMKRLNHRWIANVFDQESRIEIEEASGNFRTALPPKTWLMT